MPEKAYTVYKKEGFKQFLPRPNDNENPAPRRFQRWSMNKDFEWYQGEINSDTGMPDGLGIYILPGELITFGHRMKDKLHG